MHTPSALSLRLPNPTPHHNENLRSVPPPAPSTHVLGLLNLVVDEVAFGCLLKEHPIRRYLLRLARSPLFTNFILLNIFVNFVLLAAAQPFSPTGPGTADDVSTKLEPWFLALFTAEAVSMIVALGERAYFTDPWRVLDFGVVVLCYLVYIPGTGNASALRALRALRPLRTFGILPTLRTTFAGVLAIGKVTLTMSLLEWFFEFVFTMVGVNLWAGSMSGGCFATAPFSYLPSNASAAINMVTSNTFFIVPPSLNVSFGGTRLYRNRFIDNLAYNSDEARGYCRMDPLFSALGLAAGVSAPGATAPAPVSSSTCPPVYDATTSALVPQICAPYANPLSYGAAQMGMSYDNVGIGWLTTAVADSEEGWTTVVYTLWNTWGAGWVVSLIFIALILFKDEFIGWLDGASFMAYVDAVEAEKARMGLGHTPEGIAMLQMAELAAITEMYGPSVAGEDLHEKAGREAAELKEFLGKPARAFSACCNRLPPVPPALAKPAAVVEANAVFRYFYLALVLGNAIALGCDYVGAPPSLNSNIVVANYVFVGLFVVELVVRMLALGPLVYFKDGMNTFDAIVVTISVIEIIVAAVVQNVGGVGLSAIRVMRIFRVFRMFKVARGFKPLMDMFIIIGKALPAIGSIGFIALVLVLVFAAIGQQVFGGNYAAALLAGKISEYPRHNYDSYGWSLVSVFHLLDGENWFIPLYQHMAVNGPAAALFFFCVMFIGACAWGILLTIFMKGFDEQEEANNELEVDKFVAHEEDSPAPSCWSAKRAWEGTDGPAHVHDEAAAAAAAAASAPPHPAHFAFTSARTLVLTFPARLEGTPASVLDSGASPLPKASPAVSHVCTIVGDVVTVTTVDGLGKTLLRSPPRPGLSEKIAGVLESAPWGWLSLAFTVLSCINLGLDEPWLLTCTPTAGSYCANLTNYLAVCDPIVVAFFTLEALLCLTSNPAGFIASKWNWLDLVIVVTSIVGLALGQISTASGLVLRAIRAGRALRALRVFRIFKGFKAMEAMLDTLGGIAPAAGSAFTIVAIFFYIFAVIGLQSFGGRMNVCNDPYASPSGGLVDAKVCTGTFTLKGPTCAYLPSADLEAACRKSPTGYPNFPRSYEAILPNYDNIGNALLTVFQLSDGENWPTLMYNGVDAGTEDGDPSVRDNNQWGALYFVLCVLTFDVIVLDLLSGVVRTGYHHATSKTGGRGVLTHGQRKLVQNAQIVMETAPLSPVPPSAALAPFAHALVYGWPWFEWAVMVIVTATALCCSQWRYPLDTGTAANLNITYYILTVLLACEVGLRFAAAGPKHFFKSVWNCFDFSLFITAAVGMGLALAASTAGSTVVDYGVMRVALSLRALRALNMIRAVRHTVHWLHHMQPTLRAIRRATPRVIEVFYLKGVVIFVFAVVGCAAFGTTRRAYAGDNLGGNPGRSSGNLNSQANFETFPVALFTLFRATTGENWNMLMLDLMVQGALRFLSVCVCF